MRKVHLFTPLALVWLTVGCGARPEAQSSATEGLSADSSASNAAVFIQGNLSEAANDIRKLRADVDDEAGGYRFHTTVQLGATGNSALAAIGTGASEVSADGTLFVYMGGHGSPDGGSQMNDGRLVYYSAIRQAIAASAPQPFKRLVLLVFGCYSGSWINNVDRAGDRPVGEPEALGRMSELNAQAAYEALSGSAEGVPLFSELLVMTSSSSGQLSYYTPGGTSNFVDGFAATFAGLKARAGEATIGDLVNGTRSRVSSSTVAVAVSPENLKQEPLFNTAR